jgi:hypothetical protein
VASEAITLTPLSLAALVATSKERGVPPSRGTVRTRLETVQ